MVCLLQTLSTSFQTWTTGLNFKTKQMKIKGYREMNTFSGLLSSHSVPGKTSRRAMNRARRDR
jgi:hypothetical protein